MIKKLLLLSFIISIFFSSQAQRFAGGEIYYKLNGKQAYQITSHIYRECDAGPLDSLFGFVISDSLREPILFLRTSIEKLNDTCGNPCNKKNAFSNPGYEKHSFVGFVDFKNSPYKRFLDSGKCFVNFAIKQNARDIRARTHSTGDFYLDAGVNVCDSLITQNSSPRFSMDPKFLMAVNNAVKYSPGPMDTLDYDSLAFSLEPIEVDYKKPVTYTSNYSANIPLTPYCPPNPNVTTCKPLTTTKPPRGFYFDPLACQIIFTPTYSGEMGYVRIKVREYRKINGQMHYIGYTCREMFVTVKSVIDNNIPTFSIVQKNSSLPITCVSPTLFEISTSDPVNTPNQTIVDTTTIRYDNGYSNSNMTIFDTLRENSALLELYNDKQHINQTQYFTVSVQDKQCNIHLVSETTPWRSIPEPVFKKTYTLDSCNQFKYQVDSNNLYSRADIYNSKNELLSSISAGTPYTFNTNGKHYVRYAIGYIGSTCLQEVTDTLDIQNAFPATAFNLSKDTAVCASTFVNLKFSPTALPQIASFAWYKNDTLINTIDSSIVSQIHKSSKFELKLIDQKQCSIVLKRNINLFQVGTNLLFDTYSGVCLGDSMRILANGNSLKKPITYIWKFQNQTKTSNADSFKFKLNQNGYLYVDATDDNHCISRDSGYINSAAYISFKLNGGNLSSCIDSLFTAKLDSLSATPLSIRWIKNDSIFSFNNKASYATSIKARTKIKVEVTNQILCVSTDSIEIQAIPNPEITELTGSDYCFGDSTRLALRFKPFIGLKSLEWYIGNNKLNSTDSFIWYSASKSTIVRARLGNSGQCFNDYYKSIQVFPKVRKVKILTDTFYNPLNKIELKADSIYKSYLWFNGDTLQSSIFWASALGAPGAYTVNVLVTDMNACSSRDTLTIYTDRRLSINDTKTQALQFYPNPVQDVLTVVSEENLVYEIYNSEGKLVLNGVIQSGESYIQLKDLSSGNYTLKAGNKSYTFMKL